MASYVDIGNVIDLRQSMALNVAPGSSTALQAVIGPKSDTPATLSSDPDVDSQLLISIAFQNAVKVHSIAIKADENPPENASGPKTIYIFVDRPNLDFSEGLSSKSIQVLQLTDTDLGGKAIPLRFVKFQNVHSLQLLIESNQDDDDVTFLNRISLIGASLQGMDMKNFKEAAAETK